jgi:exodeoxyribonuclease III
MTRILTYNILVGGARRIDEITHMIRSAQADVVGLVEASNSRVVEELAKRLGMDYCLSDSMGSEDGEDGEDDALHAPRNVVRGLALLSRLPMLASQVHQRPAMFGKPVLEVSVREEDGNELTIFVAHLTASFAHSGRGGDTVRREEAREIVRVMEEKQGTPHLLMGDFNSIAPGDTLKGSRLLRYLIEMDARHSQSPQEAVGHTHLNFVVPPALRFLNPLLLQVPRSRLLCALFDGALSLYTARGTMALLRKAGYVDSFRSASPYARGFTCPARAPAGRIDYIMASPELAGRITDCYVLTEGNGVYGYQASDHLPVVAEFGEAVGQRRDTITTTPELVGDVRG